MRPDRHFFVILAVVFFCACALPAPKTVPAAASSGRETAWKFSPEDARKAEQLYYKAVGAYSNNDMAGALKYLNAISAIHPAYPPAVELREKIRKIHGNARAAAPLKP
jgi:outer membrane protein assembly factor BamD (BamD/ComL family)